MLLNIIKIAALCVVIGAASIPAGFTIDSSPWVVWVGNALGSLFSAAVVIYIGNRITDTKFKKKISKRRIGKKVVYTFDEGQDNKHVMKANKIINKHGLRLFSLFCPLFPGVLLSTVAVYILDLDKKIYKRWMFAGVIFVSWGYVFGYWYFFVK
jgi:membrane protein DedA with SNARE-associated domain